MEDNRFKGKVVHCKREPYDVYIGRSGTWKDGVWVDGKWGNPFVIGKDGTREEVIQQYEEWIKTQPHLMSSLWELKGKVLGCWCSPKACHGDVLIKLADEFDEEIEDLGF